jgi:UDP-N-acetylmuramyl pentapeptide phosphotransferase/UDP-N-acetylglucosamine-1-phosphate transferase
LLSFAAALVVIGWLVRSRWARLALDHPNSRSLHDLPKPRLGGIGILAGIAVALPALDGGTRWALMPGLLILAAVSLADDLRGVAVSARFAAHLVAAGTLAAGVVYPDFGLAAAIAATLGAAWMINLYNFMDGSDGLAGGMTLFGFFFYGLAAWLAGGEAYAFFNFAVGAAAAAFLFFNFHPARVFLGDVGAVPLGFLAAGVGLVGWQREYWTWWFPILVFSPFIVDATVTLARRALRRERVWQAHRDHFYQRLVRMGWGHRKTALAEYTLMALCGIGALGGLAAGATAQAAILASAALIYLSLGWIVDRAWLRFSARASA